MAIASAATGGSTASEAASPRAITPSQEDMEAEELEAEQETGRKRERESSDEESSDDESSGEEELSMEIERQRAALYKKLGFVEGAVEKAWRAERDKGREEQARPYTPSVGAYQNRYACLMQLGA